LLEKRLSKEEFFALPHLTGDYFDNVESTETSLSSNNKVGDTAILRLKVKMDRKLSAHLSDEKGNEISDSTFITFYDGFYQIQMAFPKEGLYSLQLFAGKGGKSLSSIGEIVYSASSGTDKVFPQQFDSSLEGAYKILSPASGTIKANKASIFLLSIPNRESVFIVYNREFLPMLASPDGNFYLSLTPAKKGDKVSVVLPVVGKKGSYETILSYTVID